MKIPKVQGVRFCFCYIFILGICPMLSSSVDYPYRSSNAGKSRSNRWISGVVPVDSAPPPVSSHQGTIYKFSTDEEEKAEEISRFILASVRDETEWPDHNSHSDSPRDNDVHETEPERQRSLSVEVESESSAPATAAVALASGGKSGEQTVKYEEVQQLLEHFLNSKLDLSNNMDVITQAFRFVKLDAHLEALLHQLTTLQESQDSLQKVTTTQETKFDVLMEQMGKLVTSVNLESNKLRALEGRLESEIGTMNHRLESAVEKIITSSATSQIMLDLSKESLQQMDRVEGAGNEVLRVLKTLKTELGDVGQASIQVIYNVQKSEETLMRAMAETGNRTIYALRQEPSSHGDAGTGIETGAGARAGENGDPGNFIQSDAANKILADDETQGLRFGSSSSTTTHKKSFPCRSSSRKRLMNGQPKDCADVQLSGYSKSGIYKIYPFQTPTQMVEVYCDLESTGGGWTVIQRRGDTQVPRESFYRSWEEYEQGFGSPHTHLWLGLGAITALTGSGEFVLRVELKDWDGLAKDANYGYFRVTNASEHYRLHVADYSGSAGDSLAYHNGMAFSAKDKDNDLERTLSCANRYHGGWWYKNCHQSNLNGMYYEGKGRQQDYATGVNWYTWHGYYYSLKSTEMKIRPRHFISR